ncbi:MAG: transposase [Chloroflexi bacterium]|nr:transposase [Chloroflexota bacterium]
MTDRPPHHRRSIRLPGYDYAQPGGYFLTVSTAGRVCLFGDVVDGEMRLNDCGQIVRDEWLRSADIRRELVLDAFVVMPNHLHAVVIINNDSPRGPDPVGATGRSPLPPGPAQRSLGSLVAGFKSAATKRINALRRMPGAPVWQRNYHDHVIRSTAALDNIREYILANPARWGDDPENPAVTTP